MLAVIKGAGDLATGIAQRLRLARIQVAMTDISAPYAVPPPFPRPYTTAKPRWKA